MCVTANRGAVQNTLRAPSDAITATEISEKTTATTIDVIATGDVAMTATGTTSLGHRVRFLLAVDRPTS